MTETDDHRMLRAASSVRPDVDLQRNYYANIAERYDEQHLRVGDEHFFALAFLVGVIDYLDVKSIMDIGSGTGRAVSYIKEKRPDVRVVGIEPVKELRDIGYQKGLSGEELIHGDATDIAFANDAFDLVCEFGVLHHIRDHSAVVKEMLRVSKTAIFLSDSNNFGQGSAPVRAAKQFLNAVGLWNVADYLKTRTKGYHVSEGDGLAYSYSVFSDLGLIRANCKSVHILNTTKTMSVNPYRSGSHVACLGIKSGDKG